MRRYDEDDAKELNAPEWMLEQLKLNPSYVSWGPHEDYMWVKGDGWNAPMIQKNWPEGKIHLDELNEVVNFYFSIQRENKECETCAGDGYHPDAKWISDSFYAHSSPFKNETVQEATAKRFLDSFTGAPSKPLIRAAFPSAETLAKYGEAFRKFCEETRDRGGYWHDLITDDEAEALVKGGRGKVDNLTTAEDFNRMERQRPGAFGHDGINRWILIEQRCERMGVPVACPTCSQKGYIYTKEHPELFLTLWLLHPRKGASRGVEIPNLQQHELPEVYAYLAEAARRNQERFAAVVALAEPTQG